uniref:DNA topoisomerase n=1 Tax=viral metagenome TaxID=1070528 RepID=A0A6C0DJA8_9ZZZZ
MSKKYSTTTTLIIVESPAKCKKIEEYLGPGYKCLASFGHLRELTSLDKINIKEDFKPTFTVINNALKKKQIELLRKEIKNADDVILATDDDREGEAISFHIQQLFHLPENTKRIVFNEITEGALKRAIQTPRTIDMNIVYAQQARQILDLLVGFKITPVLWKFITSNSENSLSAGRCQTPALRLIYDNQREIESADNKTVYNTMGFFTNMNLPFELNHQIEKEDDLIDFLDGTVDFTHVYNCSHPTKTMKSQPEPFSTSKLQQAASNELHFSPKETMKLCQSLYEAGYITYMRTDSKKYSVDFIETTKAYILKNYENKYINENIDQLACSKEEDTNSQLQITSQEKPEKKKSNSSKSQDMIQGAHEAIRPTKISLKDLPEKVNYREKKMYKLIWENTLESCMSPAIYNTVKADIQAYHNFVFNYTSELINFPGWKIVKNKFSTDNKEYQYLQTIKKNSHIKYNKIFSKATIKNMKQHYTEARLVHLLEEKGIGRPSTFSMLVEKIQERGYVKKGDITGNNIMVKDFELNDTGDIFEVEVKREFGNEKNKLILQPLGKIVIEFLDKHFADILNYDFTREMEDDLDKISKGLLISQDLCKKCNDKLDNTIDELKKKDIGKFDIKIDDKHSYTICKYGPVIKCVEKVDGKKMTTYKALKKDLDIDLNRLENGGYELEDLLASSSSTMTTSTPTNVNNSVLGEYEGKDVILKKGKFGLYISWGDSSKTLKQFGNRPIESITFEEVKPLLEEGSNMVREITKDISIRKSKKGDYVFFKTSKMKKPKFFDLKKCEEDYKTCDIDKIKCWLKETYNIF